MASRNPANSTTGNPPTNSNSGNNPSDYRTAARPSTYVAPHCRELLTSDKIRTCVDNPVWHPTTLAPTKRLEELLNQIAPGEQIDKDVEEFLQGHVDEFVDSVTEYACRIAKHRNSRTVEARDFQVHLQNKWNIRVPGYGDDPRPPAKRNVSAPVHNARMQAIAKSQQQHQQQQLQQHQQQLAQQQLQMPQHQPQDNVHNATDNLNNPPHIN